jgi:hypothetical protein
MVLSLCVYSIRSVMRRAAYRSHESPAGARALPLNQHLPPDAAETYSVASRPSRLALPFTVIRASKACNVFTRSNTGIVGLNPTQGMDVCLRLFCLCVVLCR